jgi:hypothetical protein
LRRQHPAADVGAVASRGRDNGRVRRHT